MAIKISMPKLSDTMVEGVLLKWRKKEGEVVESSEIIAEAESDKATMELEAYDSGTLLKIIVPEGGKVKVGGTLAIIGEKGEDISALLNAQPVKETIPSAASPQIPAKLPSVPQLEAVSSDGLITGESARIKASPLAKKLAAERGLDLRRIAGSGAGGRIIIRDVLHSQPAAAAPLESAAIVEDRIVPLSTMRATIARRLTQSKATAPHFYLTMAISMDKSVEFRADLNALQNDVKISYNDMIVKAAATALRNHPNVNGSFLEDKIVQHGRVDIGVAVALDEGLITPVIRNADHKPLFQIAKEIRDLATRAKDKKLTPNEYSGSTFTISNLGMYGVKNFTAVINPPEAAILAVGGVEQTPVVKEGHIVVGHKMEITLSCDHRIVDGAAGAVFLQELKTLLENPLSLMI